MKQNLESLGGLVNSQRVLLALTQAGMSREDAYQAVQRNAMNAWHGKDGHSKDGHGKGVFAELLKKDPEVAKYIAPSALDRHFDNAYHLKYVDTIFRRVFGKA
jgi:adenylosuccinate lyase